ncbi:putative amino-acid N-acetyltransferase [Lupinus albus]|uniref:Putative amino-acid N-acetyltransferase n=1 Tax=Lupinus albus TaxID=3870 RepID=A0A6A4PYG7_LUPAL|nr:putative amino-acid N-acetyltransferase [Lupinus albus]
MAATSSNPLVSLQSEEKNWLSRIPSSNILLNYGTRVKNRRVGCGCGCGSRLERSRKREVLVRGCWCGPDDYGVTEEDEEFVKVLSEAQPYIAVHRDRVFVVVISAEIVASPYLDLILKVFLMEIIF